MLIKIIGMMMVLLASTLTGLMVADKYQMRVKQLKEIRGNFQLIETEIIYTATPVIEVMDKISRQAHEPFNEIYRDIAKKLKKREGESLGVIWKEIFEKRKGDTRLKKDDLETICFFGSVLGTSDRPNQLKNTQLVQSQLLKLEVLAEEERSKNEKLFRSLGILLGFAVVIILI